MGPGPLWLALSSLVSFGSSRLKLARVDHGRLWLAQVSPWVPQFSISHDWTLIGPKSVTIRHSSISILEEEKSLNKNYKKQVLQVLNEEENIFLIFETSILNFVFESKNLTENSL